MRITLIVRKKTFAKALFLFVSLFASLLLTSTPAVAKSSVTFQKKLQQKVSVTWQDQQLAVALERLTSTAEIPLWLDRRVDRRQPVTLQFTDLPLAKALEKTVQQQSLGFVQLENLVYIGPEQIALELPTLIHQTRNQLAKLPTKQKRRWLQKEATTWPRLSEPRALAVAWLQAGNLQLLGEEKIPHDLWPEQSLPPLALIDRLVLLLAGFDLTCELAPDASSCEIVPIRRPLKLLAQRRAPQTQPKKSRRSPSHQLFTLRLENQPLGKVLGQFARQLQLEIVWNVEQTEKLRKQLISCDVKNAELDELLQSVLAPAGLQHQREGKQVTIQTKL